MTPADFRAIIGDLLAIETEDDARESLVIAVNLGDVAMIRACRAWLASSTPHVSDDILAALDQYEREADDATERARVMTAHVVALLGILDEIGGYRTIEQQDAVRAAREWL